MSSTTAFITCKATRFNLNYRSSSGLLTIKFVNTVQKILIVFPYQQWLHECSWMLHTIYVHCLSCYCCQHRCHCHQYKCSALPWKCTALLSCCTRFRTYVKNCRLLILILCMCFCVLALAISMQIQSFLYCIILSSVACLSLPSCPKLYCHLWPVWLYHNCIVICDLSSYTIFFHILS